MPIDELARVDIALSAPPLGALGFDIPLIAAQLTAPQVAELDGDTVVEVTPASWRTTLDTIGIEAGEQAYEALTLLFAQDQRPALALIGSRATAVAQVSRVAVATGTYTGTFTITIAGTTVSFVAAADDQDDVATGLRAAIQGNATTAARVTAAGTGANVDVTADYAGQPFTISAAGYAASQVTVSTTTPNVGLNDDIATWHAEDPRWYLMMEDSRDAAAILTAAAAIESFGSPKLFLAQSADVDANTSATTDIGSTLQGLGYFRTAIASYADDAVWLDAALVGATLSQPAGSITWANRRLAGIVGTEYAATTQATGKRWTLLERFRAAGISATRGGRVAQGTPIDLVIARDAIKAEMQRLALELLTSAPKIPYDDDGADQIANYAIRSTLERFAAAPFNVVQRSSIDIRPRAAALQSSTDRGNRHFPGIDWAVTLQGAIESLEIVGTMTV